MLVDELKKRITAAMKSGDAAARDVLRVALGEIQTAEARKAAALTDDDAAACIRKIIKSNDETIALASEGPRADELRRENTILGELLPKEPTVDEIAALLAPVLDAIKAAKVDGQATGVAMKHLKASGTNAPGTVVAEAVKKLRA